MIRRDWNHPSIVLWGVRINESQDNHDFYTRTNALAHELDNSRQTGGVRYLYDSELLEDVMTMNDFGFPLRPPNHPLYLNTEFNGHMFPTKRNDNVDRVMEHALRHARVHNQLASDDRYAGGIGWCAFDYNTHANFGSGDKICYHGVTDIFRIPKPAGQFYRSQCDPKEEIVLEPCFNWSQGDQSEGGGIRHAVIVSNCDHLKIYVKDDLKAEVDPDREHYGHLPHPPFVIDLMGEHLEDWGDLRIDGYIDGEKVISKTLPGNDYDRQLHVEPDDAELAGDGIDATRVVLRVTNEHGGARPFSTGAMSAAPGGSRRDRRRESVFAGGRRGRGVGAQQGGGGRHPAARTASVSGREDGGDPGESGLAGDGLSPAGTLKACATGVPAPGLRGILWNLPAPQLRRQLGFFDATMIVMGGIVGSGIFINPYVVAQQVHTPLLILGVWLIGGALAMAGAFIWAELATRMPDSGGQYLYLREAYHPAVAFIYGWVLLLVTQTGGMAAVAVTFARYYREITGFAGGDGPIAAAALLGLTAINCLGVRAGSNVQSAMMLLKSARYRGAGGGGDRRGAAARCIRCRCWTGRFPSGCCAPSARP